MRGRRKVTNSMTKTSTLSLKPSQANSNAIIKQSLYDIDKIINNHNLAFIREQLKEKQNFT